MHLLHSPLRTEDFSSFRRHPKHVQHNGTYLYTRTRVNDGALCNRVRVVLYVFKYARIHTRTHSRAHTNNYRTELVRCSRDDTSCESFHTKLLPSPMAVPWSWSLAHIWPADEKVQQGGGGVSRSLGPIIVAIIICPRVFVINHLQFCPMLVVK